MKDVLCLIVLLSCCFGCYGNYGVSVDTEEFEDQYIGNPDDFAEIVRPCPVYDLNCIRKYFAEHAHCNIARGPLPDTFFKSQFDTHLSRINFTASHTNTITTGFSNTRIEEFYVNKATNKLVFAIEARNLYSYTPSTYLQFYRRGREPIIINTNGSILYPTITFTGIIPSNDLQQLQLDKIEVTAYAQDAFPPFTLGPEVFQNPDPVVVQTVAELPQDIPTSVQETLLNQSPFLVPAYIQYNICDFGLQI